jgi:hypothetical protein
MEFASLQGTKQLAFVMIVKIGIFRYTVIQWIMMTNSFLDRMEEPVHLITTSEADSPIAETMTKSITLVSLSDSHSQEVMVATCSFKNDDIDMIYLNEYLSHKEKGRIKAQSLTKHEVTLNRHINRYNLKLVIHVAK